jgi:uncharacterized protein (TIGR02453 family)
MSNIDKKTLYFLEDLSKNNNRPWFQENKPRYELAHSNMKEFLKGLLDEFQKVDHIEKMKLFRIYRDVRFSKDKTPYKNSFGVGFHREKPQLRGGYYLHIEPGGTFVGGGFWQPNKEDLQRIREEFAFDDQPFRKIISDPGFEKAFPKGIEGDALKTAPKGFDREHPAIDLIRRKSFVASKSFTDEEVLSKDFAEKVIDTFMVFRPWFDYFSDVLTTNANGEKIV